MQTFEEKLSELVKALQRCEALTQHVKEKGEYDPDIMGTVWSVWDIAMKYHNEKNLSIISLSIKRSAKT